jgi:hypothetical protein
LSADDALLFIDASKYLDLYEIKEGKKAVEYLVQYADHVFVTEQVVDEVNRRKVPVMEKTLNDKLKVLSPPNSKVPDHLFGADPGQNADILQEMREISKRVQKVNRQITKLATDIMERVASGTDEVTKVLAPLFRRAVRHTADELQRARERKELGRAPGKAGGPLGDQLNWEQVLTAFVGKKRLWVVSTDGDYGTEYGRKLFLNRALCEDLARVADSPQAFYFRSIVDAIEHFVAATGVSAGKVLTPEEKQEIKKQEEALPPPPLVVGTRVFQSGVLSGRFGQEVYPHGSGSSYQPYTGGIYSGTFRPSQVYVYEDVIDPRFLQPPAGEAPQEPPTSGDQDGPAGP